MSPSNPCPPPSRCPDLGLLTLAALVAVACSAALAGWVVAARIGHPFALEVMEDGIAAQAVRAAAGLPLYAAPSADYAPYLYGPVFAWLGGAAFAWLGASLWVLRAISLAATAWALVELWRLGARLSGHAAGALAAGLLVATYRPSAAWFDLARVDMLALALLLASCRLLLHGRSLGLAVGLGVLSVYTKQSSLPILTAVAAATALHEPRRGVTGAACLLAAVAVLGALGHCWTEGRSTFFLWELPARHALLWPLLPEVFVDKLLVDLGGYLALAAAGAVHLARSRGIRQVLAVLGLCLAALAVSCWARLRDGGWYNVMIPGHAGLALLAAVGLVALDRRVKVWWVRGLVLAGLAAQLAWIWGDPRQLVPDGAARANARRVHAVLEGLDGEVLAPGKLLLLHGHGKTMSADQTALWDLRRGADRALAEWLEQELVGRLERGVYRCLLLPDPSAVTPRYPVVLPAFAAGGHAHTAMPLPDVHGMPVPGFERLYWHVRAEDRTLIEKVRAVVGGP